MYSDIWIKTKDVHKSPPIALTEEISLCKWMSEKDGLIGIGIDFEYADDIHYEFLIDDWNLFVETVLGGDKKSDYIPLLKDYFAEPSSHLKFGLSLRNNNIKHTKVAFY